MHACLDQILERVLCKQLGAHIITHSNTHTHARFNERIDYYYILGIRSIDVTAFPFIPHTSTHALSYIHRT